KGRTAMALKSFPTLWGKELGWGEVSFASFGVSKYITCSSLPLRSRTSLPKKAPRLQGRIRRRGTGRGRVLEQTAQSSARAPYHQRQKRINLGLGRRWIKICRLPFARLYWKGTAADQPA